MRYHVLVEFGGRNIIDPNAVHAIQPDVAELFQGVAFPWAEGVVVLAPEGTHWEKVTLIHTQCNRQITEGRERISRHWYDLAMGSANEP
ncbi:nucleotidyl transferase AbiEii/AbiGii toxin family protein [Pseudomonas sp. EA_35y_Pfl2_R5]|uniref:nucleotidyl transferase AbiEii/AbiGii toxin family protein n=1 Tax=Pseudomonas sp. EA_35y_Pfl2_R5 TaxID=3088690 RepID=UPI0030D7A42C